MPNPKANAPAAPNSLQRVVSFRMIYSFAFDPEAPGRKPRGHHRRSGIKDTVAEFLRSGAGKPPFTRLSPISGSRNLSRCFVAKLNGN
jgi:hypothetical protein